MKKNVKYFVSDGTEISEGDTVTITNKKVTEDGFTITKKSIKVTEDTIPYLVDNNIITVQKGEEENENPQQESESEHNSDELTLDNIIEFIAEERQWKKEQVAEYMIDTYFMSPAALYEIVYQYVYCFLECTKYENDEWYDPFKMYYITPIEHNVKHVSDTYDFRNRYITTFRTREDAKNAIAIGKIAIETVEDAIADATEE